MMYVVCACLGFSSGYWTLFITVAAELFGSNLRATVATTIPNFVRATVIPLTALFVLLKGKTGIVHSALIVGVLAYLLALLALFYLEETFKKEMDYTEEENRLARQHIISRKKYPGYKSIHSRHANNSHYIKNITGRRYWCSYGTVGCRRLESDRE